MKLPLTLVALFLIHFEMAHAGEKPVIAAGRIETVAGMLDQTPDFPGRPISDRKAWERLTQDPDYPEFIANVSATIGTPLPASPDELFLEFTRNGARAEYDKTVHARRGRLYGLVLAECIEAKGRFLPDIEKTIAALCAERTWVLSAHDRKLDNFHGRIIDVDLFSAILGWNMALAERMLEDRLSAESRKLIRENVRRRVIDPFLAAARGDTQLCFWLHSNHNWNTVCLSSCTGAALALTESKTERAEVIALAEHYSKNFLKGFAPDGYCSEGLGYWNFGFGHYVLLSETIRQATGGKLDLMLRPEARAPAIFGPTMRIIGGISPSFADCKLNERPSSETSWYVNRRFGMGLKDFDTFRFSGTLGNIFDAAIYNFQSPDFTALIPGRIDPGQNGIRSWFPDAGILIGRPAPGSASQFGVATKGGHNAEHHNHNDLGSYVVVVGNKPVLLDPGKGTYTAETFGSKRYDSKLLNSYGHPVPVVGGQLQRTGADARAVVLRKDFTDAADSVTYDLSSAYPCPELKQLERSFRYSRDGSGSLTVTDRVQFTKPQTFGTALITLGKWQLSDDGKIIVRDGEKSVRIEIQATGGEIRIDSEKLDEDKLVMPTRIGINFNQPVADATITLKILPE
ncbi:MAG: heparinase II/III family protein [Akkermansiaceae bacterium]